MSQIFEKDLEGITPYKLLEELDLRNPPFDPFEIANKLGIKISQELNWENFDTSGSIRKDGNGVTVWINPMDAETRQRFTLAHEIGHYINDIIPNNGVFSMTDTPETLYRAGESKIEEYKANNFAGQLLMPKKAILQKATELLNSTSAKSMPMDAFVEKMAKLFNVSKPAMLVRLKVLGMIDQSTSL